MLIVLDEDLAVDPQEVIALIESPSRPYTSIYLRAIRPDTYSIGIDKPLLEVMELLYPKEIPAPLNLDGAYPSPEATENES